MSLRPSRSDEVDSDLHRAIARLSVRDIERLGATGGYRGVGGSSPDANLAIRLAMEEARRAEAFERDRALALSLQDESLPLVSPTGTPATSRAGPSRQSAYQLRVQPNTRPTVTRTQPTVTRTPVQSTALQAGTLFEALLNGIRDWWTGTTRPVPTSASFPTSSSRAPRPAPQNAPIAPVSSRPTGHDCVSCMDPIRGVEVRAPCGHHYDKTCILGLFEAATKDESLYPPRCCRAVIPISSVEPYMTVTALDNFRRKAVEFGTRKRVYCAKPSCSRFLGKQYEGSHGVPFAPKLRCRCGTSTCTSCKNAVSSGVAHVCSTNEADRHVLSMGQESGWARCPGCETMIELNMGCYHMTCRCRTEFCYLCRAPWKTCACPQWDERRLLDAAEERADAQIRLGAGAEGVRRRPAAPPIPPRPARHVPAPVAATADVVAPARRPQLDVLLGVVPADARSAAGRTQLTAAKLATTARDSTPAHPQKATPRAGSSRQTGATPATDRDVLIRQWQERLRVDHDCQHEHWTTRRGEGTCQVCHDRLPLFLHRCNGCEMLACRRCRWNRL